MRLSGFKIYRTLLALLMLLASTLGPLAHAKTNGMVHHDAIQDMATTDQMPEHGHGHSHDIEPPKDHTLDHSHEHNPADHSHEVPGNFTIPSQISPNFFSNRRSISVTSQVDRVSFDIDRPPRF